MSFNKKMVETKLRGIQAGVDDIGNRLFSQNEQLGGDLKMFAFEVGMVRATLDAELAQQTDNSDYAAALRVFNQYHDSIDSCDMSFLNFCEQRLNSAKAPNCA
jgi:hypothetical protein